MRHDLGTCATSTRGHDWIKVDTWKPQQYDKFEAERRLPFDELLAMCTPTPAGLAYDLGCGTGSTTADIPTALETRMVIGSDTSQAMLDKAGEFSNDRLRFEIGNLAKFNPSEDPDVIISNAALHWVSDHATVLASWRSHLHSGDQLAVQVPANSDHPSQQIAADVASNHADWFDANTPPPLISTNSLTAERYAEVLYDLGAVQQKVMLRVYPHVLDTTLDVVQWMKGTTLNAYRAALIDESNYDQLVAEIEEQTLDHFGLREPFFYTFKRILFWAQF